MRNRLKIFLKKHKNINEIIKNCYFSYGGWTNLQSDCKFVQVLT